MATQIFGIKIILDDYTRSAVVAADASIGLYNVASANSELRWYQADISGLSPDWCETMIAEKGIGKYSREIKLDDGGNIAQPGTASVIVKNTAKFDNTIKGLSIYLQGCAFEVWLFTDSTPARQWSGIIDGIERTARTYTISAKGFHEKRIANIGTLITDSAYSNPESQGTMIPVSFGKFVPEFDGEDALRNTYAKFVRTNNERSIFQISHVMTLDVGTVIRLTCAGSAAGRMSFPIIGNDGDDPPIMYKMQILDDDPTEVATWTQAGLPISGTYSLDYFVGKYIHVVKGTGEGQYRKISAAQVIIDTDAINTRTIELTLANYFPDTLAGNSTATASGQSWVQIETINMDFECDKWPCKDFLDIDGASATLPDIFGYGSKQSSTTDADDKVTIHNSQKMFYEIPKYAFEEIGSSNNGLTLRDKFGKGDVDTIYSHSIIPFDSIEPYSGALTRWKLSSGDNVFHDFHEKEDGIYTSIDDISLVSARFIPSANYYSSTERAKCLDRDLATSWGFTVDTFYPGDVSLGLALKLKFPQIKQNVDFDSVAFMIALTCSCGGFVDGELYESGTGVKLRAKPWKGYSAFALVESDGDDFWFPTPFLPLDGGFLYSYLDQYCGGSSNNKYFYYVNPVSGNNDDQVLGGIERYKIDGIDDVAKYRTLQNALIWLYVHYFLTGVDDPSLTVNLFECAVVFLKTLSISEAIYATCSARIYNDTWGSRKTAADLMESPLDVLEHVCRLQNWYEVGAMPAGGWGKAYASGALVKTTGDGSFDASDGYLEVVRNFRTAFQVLDYSEAYTDKIKRTLCRNFHLASWVDKDGKECVKRIVKPQDASTDTIALGDIIDRRQIKVTDPEASTIYPEPFVRYNYNSATGKYDSAIRITQSAAATWSEAYTEGLDGGESEEYWGRCHALWAKCKQINNPPSDLTDLRYIGGQDADAMAKEYLTNWIDWMFNPSIEFSVHFNKAGAWEECHRFILNLPHQTNAANIECMVTEIEVNPNAPYDVRIKAIMYSETIPEDFNIQKTLDDLTGEAEWIKSLDAQGGTNDIQKVN